MKLSSVALILLPMAAAVEGSGPVVDGMVCEKKMYTDSKWRPDIIKIVYCAIDGPATYARIMAYGVDEDNKRLFQCMATLDFGTLQTCCKVDGKGNKCDIPVPYKIHKHLEEDVIGLWLNWESDGTYIAVSNGYSAAKTDKTDSSGDKIVNATVEGQSGIKYCFPWACEVGPDGKILC